MLALKGEIMSFNEYKCKQSLLVSCMNTLSDLHEACGSKDLEEFLL